MTPPGSGRTRNSTVWHLPPPEETGPDTPGPGRSLATRIPLQHGRPFEDRHPADFPCHLCRKTKGGKQEVTLMSLKMWTKEESITSSANYVSDSHSIRLVKIL